ncbi:hypothetical protein T492DRAFT_853839 [Pavlovales sp. CCMP2436]|nr:hypothetical protein T492DRAFT_853839 [Pavlovales sp. CCMP2436]
MEGMQGQPGSTSAAAAPAADAAWPPVLDDAQAARLAMMFDFGDLVSTPGDPELDEWTWQSDGLLVPAADSPPSPACPPPRRRRRHTATWITNVLGSCASGLPDVAAHIPLLDEAKATCCVEGKCIYRLFGQGGAQQTAHFLDAVGRCEELKTWVARGPHRGGRRPGDEAAGAEAAVVLPPLFAPDKRRL